MPLYLPVHRHLNASPKPPLIPQHAPHAWAMGGVRIMMVGGYTDNCGRVVTSLVVCIGNYVNSECGHSQCITDMLCMAITESLKVVEWGVNQR